MWIFALITLSNLSFRGKPHAETTDFSYYILPDYSYGIRNWRWEHFSSSCRIVEMPFMIVCRENVHKYVCGKKRNGRMRRHCARSRFLHEEYPKQFAIFNSARKYLHLNDDAGEYENRFPSIIFVFPIHAIV